MGFSKALKDNKTKKVVTKKSSVVEITDAPKEIKDSVDAYVAALAAKKAAEAELKLHGATFSEFCLEKYDENGFGSKFSKSYSVASDDNLLKYVSPNRFSIDTDDEPKLKKLFGKKFETMFNEKFDVKLKDEVFKNEALQDELMELVGEDNFAKFFDTVSSFSVVENYDEKVFDIAGTQDKLDEIRTFVKPTKASLK